MAKRGLVKHIPLEPIKLGCFTLTETGMEVEGKPSFSDYQGVGDFISRAVKSSNWWAVDWLKYGRSRPDWKERLDALLDVTQYSEETARKLRYLGENLASERRRADVDFSAHIEVAPLPPREQEHWLEEAASRGLSTRELRAEIRAAARTKVIAGQARLEGVYRVIYADPPWLYGDSGATEDGSLGKAERHYPGMTIEELCNLPVQAHAAEHSVLFCWTTAPMLYENPGPREVIEAWGFKPKTQHVWDKVLGNYGHYSHVTHEILIVATRGSCLPDVPTPSPKSVHTIRRTAEHSAKPEEFRQMIEKQYTTGPYLELFGRKPVRGWSVFGNDARLWASESREIA
jgi:N6-adenosine-specific RNA methylase IME4